jgi:transcriptional regulator with XRE-family HTH domain
MNFSEKLQYLRKGKNLSQEELAEVMNVSRQSVSKWELGQSFPDIDKLVDISNYFGFSLDCLLKDDKVLIEDGAIEATVGDRNNDRVLSVIKKRSSLIAVIGLPIFCGVLSSLYFMQNIYQVVNLGIISIVGIVLSLYVLIKNKKNRIKNII